LFCEEFEVWTEDLLGLAMIQAFIRGNEVDAIPKNEIACGGRLLVISQYSYFVTPNWSEQCMRQMRMSF
jgi:hypothetical protein